MVFKKGKFYKTKGGQVAYIISTDSGFSDHPIEAVTRSRHGSSTNMIYTNYTVRGYYYNSSFPVDGDLVLRSIVEVREKVKFLNLLCYIGYIDDRRRLIQILKSFQTN